MIQNILKNYLSLALHNLGIEALKPIVIEKCKNKDHGHFATNIALLLAKDEKINPRELAQKIINQIKNTTEIEKIDIAGPGFINFSLKQSYLNNELTKIIELNHNFGQGDDKNLTILLEFVSANPTGPLHIGHARGAAFGMVLANLLEKAGYRVIREYYVNDAGRQMDILSLSSLIRFFELVNFNLIVFPKKAYQGEYIKVIAQQIKDDAIIQLHSDQMNQIGLDFEKSRNQFEKLDAEKQLDFLIEFFKNALNSDWFKVKEITLNSILDDIKNDLEEFGLTYDSYFSENSLHEQSKVNEVLNILEKQGYLYEKDGSKVFASSQFGDDKDRVVIRSNGQLTYFGTDIAYHLNKLSRADLLINIWGADHHGYIARMKSAIDASGKNPNDLEVLLVQFVLLIQNQEKISMSTRSGEFISLRDLRNSVSEHLKDLSENFGNDTTRFFFVQKTLDQHMEFDWDLATSKKQDNPIIYLNYAYARIQSVLSLSSSKKIMPKNSNLELLNLDIEKEIIFNLLLYPEIIERAAEQRIPHLVSRYLLDLVGLFHTYYGKCKFIEDDKNLSEARLYLIDTTAKVIKNALAIFGINPLNKM